MGIKSILFILLSIAIAIVPLACGNGLEIIPGPYSEAILNGVWFVGSADYFVTDGLGNIVDHSFFANLPSGSYSVTNAGSFTMDIDDDASTHMTFEGRLVSNTSGKVTFINGTRLTSSIAINNVPDVSALGGTLSGTLEQTCDPAGTVLYKNICDTAIYNVIGLSVDADGAVTGGEITNTPGADHFSVQNTGGAYAIGNSVVIFLHTDAVFTSLHKPYGLIKINGTLSGGVINGTYELASDFIGQVGVANLTF